MNTAEQIILIILAAALALFITLAIVIAVQVIRLVKILRSIAERAQELVDNAESAAETLKSAVGKLSVLRFAHSVFDMVSKHKK
jgi:cell division protein FtsB